LYSFSQRPDTTGYDEPTYPHFLRLNPGIYRPYRDELLSSTITDGNDILVQIKQNAAIDGKIHYCKHIARMREELRPDLLYGNNTKHIFLIRDPFDVVAAWSAKNDVHYEGCTIHNTCFPQMVQAFFEAQARTGCTPIVVDTSLLKKYPREILMELCYALNIPFCEEMLSWPAGPKAVDGMWASVRILYQNSIFCTIYITNYAHSAFSLPFILKHWYESVHASTGFNGQFESAARPAYSTLSSEQRGVYHDAVPLYEILRKYALGRHPLATDSSCTPGSRLYLPLSEAAAAAAAASTDSAAASATDEQKNKKEQSASTSTQNKAHILDHGLAVPATSLSDPQNAHLLAWVGDRLLPRTHARVSVFDSTVQGGDAVWEGLRVYDGRVFKLEEHLDRLFDSAAAMGFASDGLPTREFIRQAIFKTLAANGMRDHTHVRLTLSRGLKISSSMNPMFNCFGSCLIVLPEFKRLGSPTTYNNSTGVSLITAAGRRNSPQCCDSKIHHCNLINNILPKIQANLAGAADAVMLDVEGYVSETNATNIFLVKNNTLITPLADHCLPGVTRATVLALARRQIHNSTQPKSGRSDVLEAVEERRVSLAELHAADEVFTTGTMGELTPVCQVDGRVIGANSRHFSGTNSSNSSSRGMLCSNPVTQMLQVVYRDATLGEGTHLPF
jgi:branched-subunit amino acid aminotransferase/4-amino-4-deoxychorismate lyase